MSDPPRNVISLELRKQARAHAEAPKCGDGCTWALPSLLVHGLPDGQAISITFACPQCGSEYITDVE